MKKVILIIMSLFLSAATFAHDIEVKNEDGVTIYYNYTNDGKELAVTFCDFYYYKYPDRYRGNVVIPEVVTYMNRTRKVTSIGPEAFRDCAGLSSVIIGNRVASIDDGAFRGCYGLTSITIPNSVTSISGGAFSECSGLTSINVDVINPKYDSRENCNAIIETATNTLLIGCKNTTFPNSVTSIGDGAFEGCSGLTSITIPNSVTSIGNNAFAYCSALTSITIPKSVTSIGSCAFLNCTGLKKVIVKDIAAWCGISFGDNPLMYTNHLFVDENTEIKDLVIPKGVTSIGNNAFAYCSGLTSITIPNSVVNIGEIAFFSCSGLTSVTIPNSVTSIGNNAFAYCSGLTSVTIPNSVTSIGSSAFSICSGLTSITIPNSVTSIGSSAFEGCSGLTSITIPNSVTSIEGYVFSGCSSFTSITIPNSVTKIKGYAFPDCTSLTSITIPNSVTKIYSGAFDGVDIPTIISLIENPFEILGKTSVQRIFSLNTYNNSTLYVPKGTIDKYKATKGWKDFVFIEEITQEAEDGVTEVKAIPVLILAEGNTINVQGAAEGTEISAYNANGIKLSSTIANKGMTKLNTQLPSGSTAIVKIGEKSVKVLVK